MREIKFRGKRFDNNHNDWIYGHIHVIDTCGEGYTGKAIQQQFGTSRPYSVSVHPNSVGQYTGLKDKNGKEIYEGDIVRFLNIRTKHEEWEIKYSRSQFILFAGSTYFSLSNIDLDFVETIGNIYDNPELLEGETK